jgi:protein-disulfide isomerase
VLAQYLEQIRAEAKVEVLLPPYLPAKVEVAATGPSKGPDSAPVTIVEFSDFQCPYCSKAEATVKDLLELEKYKGKLKLVYRDYPLPSHNLAPKAAEAAHCAGDQGKYWEMHDRLFAATPKLEVTDLKAYARELKLDEGRFTKCLDSGDKAKVVADHFKAGNDAGVRGTPAFFINGRLISGAQKLEAFTALIDAELAAGK